MRNIIVLFREVLKIGIVMCLSASSVLTLGCGKKMTVKKGDIVKIKFTATLDDGTVIDKSKVDEPMEFTAGSGNRLIGLSQVVIGMKINEKRRITVKPEEAFGLRDESKVGGLPKTAFPEDYDYTIGKIVEIKDNEGKIMKGVIIAVADENVRIDLNHPLAGKNITYDVKIVEID